jgi:hypothetical protein
MRIVAGEVGSDTVQAILREPLTIEVGKASGPSAGIPVVFERIVGPGGGAPTISISKTGEEVFQSSMTIMTDAQGRASVKVRLGATTGDDYLRVTCAACNHADTLRYGVTPGNAALVVADVRDTTVIIGDEYRVRGATIDRFGNRRTEPVTFVSGSPLVTVDSVGEVVVGGNTGRGAIAVRSGTLTDSARFEVVTGPTIAAVISGNSAHQDSGGVIVTTTLNGLRQRRLTYTGFDDAYPVPSPTADLVAYQRGAGGLQVFVVDGSGQNRRLVAAGRFIDTQLPRFSPDGRFIYFTARDSSIGYGIWRIGVDGAGLTLIAPASGLERWRRRPMEGASRIPVVRAWSFSPSSRACCGSSDRRGCSPCSHPMARVWPGLRIRRPGRGERRWLVVRALSDRPRGSQLGPCLDERARWPDYDGRRWSDHPRRAHRIPNGSSKAPRVLPALRAALIVASRRLQDPVRRVTRLCFKPAATDPPSDPSATTV